MAPDRGSIGKFKMTTWVAIIVLVIAAFLHVRLVLWTFCLTLSALYFFHDLLLGRLAGWGISKTPKAYHWTIDRICIRPSWSMSPNVWSEVIVTGWTWHNPPGFEDDSPSFLLYIDRLTLRVDLSTIYAAVRYKRAVKVDMLLIENACFRTFRNKEGALNLWVALALPDQDVNVNTIWGGARSHGALNEPRETDPSESLDASSGGGTRLQPLPPVATEATRRATNYWRPEWGDRDNPHPDDTPERPRSRFSLRSPFKSKPSPTKTDPSHHSSADCLSSSSASNILESRTSSSVLNSSSPDSYLSTRSGVGDHRDVPPLPPQGIPPGYKECPIGDPRRRPRWGVPVRFDIRQVVLLRMDLHIFDLMMLEARTTVLVEPERTKIHVASVDFSRDRLEKGDERRSGCDDSVHGVYLGELIWVLIAEAVPVILKNSPSQLMKNALFASVFAAKDASLRLGARIAELPMNAAHALKSEIKDFISGPTFHGSDFDCRLLAHLISGRRMTSRSGRLRVNVFARLDLQAPADGPSTSSPAVIDTATSHLQMWTHSPSWHQRFELGPILSAKSTLRVACYHRRTRQVMHLERQVDPEVVGNAQAHLIGEVLVPLQSLLMDDVCVQEGNDVVGWFTLADAKESSSGGIGGTGEVKLGLRLVNAGRLKDRLSANGPAEVMPDLPPGVGRAISTGRNSAQNCGSSSGSSDDDGCEAFLDA